MSMNQQLTAQRPDLCMQFADCIGLQAAANGLNFVFSPLSIRTALSLAAVGSNGQTLENFLSFLGSPTIKDLNAASDRLFSSVRGSGSAKEDTGVESLLSFVNGIWVDLSLTLNPSFQETANSIYDAVATSVDFQNKPLEAVEEVNGWVRNKTNDLIKDLIPADAVNELTQLVILANALYFKGPWAEKFDSAKNIQGEFHLLDGSSIQVPFMTSRMDQLIARFDGFQVLKLPYKPDQAGRKLSMLVFLPDQKDGLADLVQKAISSSGFFDIHVPTGRVRVGKLMIPKFKISSRFNASDALRELGLQAPFVRGHADFGEMVLPSVVGRELFISSVHHKATIEVGEEGTEASAATTVTYRKTCYYPPVNFVADHPFMFAIIEERHGVILFQGHVANPSEAETLA